MQCHCGEGRINYCLTDDLEYVLMQSILGDHIRWISSPSNDPITNLAFERWALEEDTEDALLPLAAADIDLRTIFRMKGSRF